jgi:hypothetical protein
VRFNVDENLAEWMVDRSDYDPNYYVDEHDDTAKGNSFSGEEGMAAEFTADFCLKAWKSVMETYEHNSRNGISYQQTVKSCIGGKY